MLAKVTIMRNALVIILLSLILSGCTTKAIRDHNSKVDTYHIALKQYEESVTQLKNKEKELYRKLESVGIVWTDEIELKHKLINEYFPDELVGVTAELFQVELDLFEVLIGEVNKSTYWLAEPLLETHTQLSKLEVNLLNKSITIGQYNTARAELYNNHKKRHIAADMAQRDNVNAVAREEVAQRQQAIQNSIQNQQNRALINAVNRGNNKSLQCNTIGTVTTCD